MFQIRTVEAKSILSPVSGFLREAGFTHSLSPARNCTYGCTYCYVPTLGIYGGLKREDWTHWGQFTTLKTNARERAVKELRRDQIIYCSPLVDPYQPAEREQQLMPGILESVCENPPRIFVIQTRGPLILRDIRQLKIVGEVTRLRISFSTTTQDDEVRRRYEPHCESNTVRLETIRNLQDAGLEVYATLAPLLPCNPERLATLAIAASSRDLIGDPLHSRANKRTGATTRDAAFGIARHHKECDWWDAVFQESVIQRIRTTAAKAGKRFVTGPAGFGLLAQVTVDDGLA